ncbi:PD-(D/E)XK nuclease family protein [Flavobacterium sp. xlx-214]|uniref:PD-(D/E)XK nuclease family protein n=1 Tax=unclassified Flavobacterium TaxID=196869 RepID=UPI0013D0F680|nr:MULTISPECIES: PD-(D/E)XK nuclease family protein [unclassified Flavobacterium]MBA5792871.1 PD-(D/E)XK nuclease family protein [Flavobacterium sp. xlx-221]QMI84794.1 PD-(D/E)XK nuclease family protein [Flavobacterium sp. xlx-214]
MKTPTFLSKLAEQIITNHEFNFADITIVLPNKRARLFLLEAFKEASTTTFFAPNIISIEDLIADIANLYSLNNVEQLFEFYEVYKKVTPLQVQQDFEQFSNWAKMLLQDFNEIDRYLLKPEHVFDYLKDIDDINHWSVKTEDRTTLVDNYLTFWSQLPTYYHALQKHLLEINSGYQGLIYRVAVDKLNDFLLENNKTFYYFAGFNALNQAEESIIQRLLKNNSAKIYWDTDETFLNDFDHGAGYFARKIKQNWSYYKSHPYEWLVNEFNQNKQIEIISTPKSVGQAKIVGSIVHQLQQENTNLQRTAIVLSEENLLIPVLYALPNEVTALNVTMNYDSKSNPVQLFFLKLFKMHVNAVNRGSKPSFYHKEVLDVLSHPLIEHLAETKTVVSEINKRNLSFFQFEKLDFIKHDNACFDLICKPWTDDVLDVLDRLETLVFLIKDELKKNNDAVSLTFLYAFHKVLTQVKNYQLNYQVIGNVQQLFAIYKQIADLAEVSFEGEPLEGLQVMGVLESRVLDFDTVIITSLNEGKFPAGKSSNSFIPHDVKMELGLPTYKEKDAIYTYHFYHLLLRAKNIYLLYNSDSEGLDAGEKSRFITQLTLDSLSKHTVNVSNYFAKSPETVNNALSISKSLLLQERLKEIATDKGFSPSAIGNYMRNPMQFYMQRVLGIREVEEVEENIALNTLGTIIHGALEMLYMPYVGQKLTSDIISDMLLKSETEIVNQFAINYSDTVNKQGKNLLAFEVAKRNVYHFLMLEKEAIDSGDDVVIVGLEEKLEATLTNDLLPYPVHLSGIADRVEIRNGVLRIIDYKTGKVDLNQVQINTLVDITNDLKFEKAIQLLMYGLMYRNKTNLPLQAGIYSFKNRKSGYLMFGLKEEKVVEEFITTAILDVFEEELVRLLVTILNPKIAFEEKVV